MPGHRYRMSRAPALSPTTGAIIPSARLYFWESGASSVAQATYSDAGRTSTNANPLSADANGFFASDIFLQDLPYRVELRDATGASVLWTEDPVYPAKTRLKLAALPSTNWPGLEVHLTSDGHLWVRNAADDAWVDNGPIDTSPVAGGRQTLWIPAGAMTVRTTNGPGVGSVETTTNKVMISTLDFDASTIEYAQFKIRMPKGWDEGTISAEFVWSHAATATNFGVVWAIQAVTLSNDDAQDAAFGTAQTAIDTGGTTNDLYRSPETSAVTIAGTPAEEDVVVFQVYRDASNGSDTMTIDARLEGVCIFYTTNAVNDA